MKKKSIIGDSSPNVQLRKIKRIMRLTTFLLSFCVVCAYADQAHTQNVRISLNKTNVVLEEVLNEIEAQSNYLFVYNNEVQVNRKVSVKAENKALNLILDEILKNSGLSYRVEGSHIILQKSSISAPQQQRSSVKGTVLDETGEPIIGANVYQKNTTNGAITDIDGNFTLTLPANAVLVISYIGYIQQEVNIGNNTIVEILLEEDTKRLEEVVVIGYGSQKKADLTGSVSTVGSDVLESRPIASVGAGLQGVVPGLNISFSSGAPGQGAKFNVRGVSNFNDNGALVLVDGMEMDPTLINPSDIKEVTVLKDAASAAIYGARAAFGVVLITTKDGFINKKPQVKFDANYAFNAPTVKAKYMNSLEYTQWMNDANMNTNGNPYFDQETMDHVIAYYNDPVNNLPVFHHSADAASQWRYAGNTDWYKELNKNTYPTQQYNVSIAGGSESATYYASAGYFNQGGLSRWAAEDYDRYNILQKVRYKVAPWIQVGLNTSLAVTDQITGGLNNSGTSALASILAGDSRPLMPLYHPDGNFSGASGDGSFTNLAAWQSQGGNQMMKRHDVMANTTLKLTPLAGLSIDFDYTYKYYNYSLKNHKREYYDYNAAGEGSLFPHTSPNQVRHVKRETFNQAFNAYATYEKKFNEIHSFKIMGGYNQESYLYKAVELSRNNLISNDIPYLSLATGDRYTSDAEREWTTRSALFRVNYTLMDKYLFQVTGRYDGSSRFPKDDRFVFFPSYSVGWKISEENFWKPVKYYVNNLKLKASYGSLGNQNTNTSTDDVFYPYIPTFSSGEANYLFDGSKEMRVYAPGLVSPTLTWETVTSWNIGLEFGLFDNKLIGEIAVYQSDTKDMLTLSKQLPAILGVAEPSTNSADLRTRGWEFELTWRQALQNGFTYSITGSISDYTRWITKYDNPTKSLGTLSNAYGNFYEGKKMGEIWGFVTDGLFATDEEAAAWDQSSFVGYSPKAGDIKFADLDKSGSINKGAITADDSGDMKVIGNTTPRYQFGLRGIADWKGFDLTLFFQGVMKRDIMSNSTFYLAHYGSEWSVPQKMNYDYWREDNTGAFFPRARFNGGSAINEPQTRFMQNAAYIRLKQFQLGYTLPFKYVSIAKITKARIYFNAENLWEHSKMKEGFDPEIAQVNLYPLMRAYSFGVNVTF